MSKNEGDKSDGDEYMDSLASLLGILKARAKALEAGSTAKQESEECNDPEEWIIFTEEDLREFFPEDDEEEPQIMKRNTFLDMLNGVDKSQSKCQITWQNRDFKRRHNYRKGFKRNTCRSFWRQECRAYILSGPLNRMRT